MGLEQQKLPSLVQFPNPPFQGSFQIQGDSGKKVNILRDDSIGHLN
jgi:hypothetical protein